MPGKFFIRAGVWLEVLLLIIIVVGHLSSKVELPSGPRVELVDESTLNIESQDDPVEINTQVEKSLISKTIKFSIIPSLAIFAGLIILLWNAKAGETSMLTKERWERQQNFRSSRSKSQAPADQVRIVVINPKDYDGPIDDSIKKL